MNHSNARDPAGLGGPPVHKARQLPRTWAKFLAIVLPPWLLLVMWVGEGSNPLSLFRDASHWGVALMFTTGAIIANATAVGGGMVFNPTLQLLFGVGGYAALTLAILVQCAGMTSGSLTWYRRGAFRGVSGRQILWMVVATMVSTACWSLLLVLLRQIFQERLLWLMRTATAGISLYVFALLWNHIRASRPGIGQASTRPETMKGDPSGGEDAPLIVDRRMLPWICFGSLLNAGTAVGTGELVFSHLVKYYQARTEVAVAVGTLMQAVSVLTQAVFILIFWRELIIVPLVLIGLLFCALGGRIAPVIMSLPRIRPHAKLILALTALSMAVASGIKLF